MISSSQAMEPIDVLSNEKIEILSTLLLSVIHRLNTQLDDLAFNLWVSTPPLHEDRERSEIYPFYIRIVPRIYRFGGFEVNSEMMINPIMPELAAKILRGENDD
jgi:UDPglucose--hexose-1-phosphate uridylyltransferase